MIDGRRAPRSTEESAAATKAAERRRWYRRLRLGARLAAHGVTANMVTVAGVVVSAATAVLIALGQLHVAVGFFIAGGLMDSLDGAVAKASGSASHQGAYLDSVADRLSDGVLLCGVAWYLASGTHPRLALLPFAVLVVSGLVSYERGEAESLGLDAKGGLMERAERMILLGLGILLPFILVPVLWALLVLTAGTAVGRFVRVWRQAGGAPTSARLGEAIWRTGRVESRWRGWREQGAFAGGVGGFGSWHGRPSRATGHPPPGGAPPGGGDPEGGEGGAGPGPQTARALHRRLDDSR